MNNAKRALALLLCLVMVLSYVPTHGYAANEEPNVTISLPKTEVVAGDVIDVWLGINETKASSIAFGFDFDNTLLQVTGISAAANAKLTYSGVDDFGDPYKAELSATAVSTKDEANNSGHVGCVWANAFEVSYEANDQIVRIRFTALKAGTIELAMFEDSAGSDSYKGDWTYPAAPSACDHVGKTYTYEPNTGDTHKVICECGEVVNASENCSGGTATCTAAAKCSLCKAEYGSALGHKDDNKDHVCDNGCGVAQGEHKSNAEYACQDGTCAYCGKPVAASANHTGGNATCTEKAKCSVCGTEYGSALGHKDDNKDHVCDNGCGVAQGEHKSNAEYACQDGTCAYCGKTVAATANHTDGDDKNHDCDVCGAQNIEDHTEDTKTETTPATCTEDGKVETVTFCTECGAELGRKTESTLPAGHSWGTVTYNWNTDNTACTATRTCEKDETHKETETVDTTSSDTAGTCQAEEVVTYTATFTADWAVPQTKTVTGEKNTNNHTTSKVTYSNDGETHSATYNCCGAEYVTNEAHNYDATTHKCICGAVEPVVYSGWTEINGDWYYYDPDTNTAVTGLTRVPYPTEPINGITYAPDAEAMAYCKSKGETFIDATEAWFDFGENGKFDYENNGYHKHGDSFGKLVNGMLAWHPGLIKIANDQYSYFIGDVVNGGNKPAEGDTYITKNNGIEGFAIGDVYNFVGGRLSDANGVVDGKYYQNSRLMMGYGLTETEDGIIYVRTNGMLATGVYYITNLSNYTGTDLVDGDKVTFDADGYAIEGIVGGYYYVNGKLAYNAGVVEIEDGKYIYVRSNGKVVMGMAYWITNVGESGLVAKQYTFDADGIMQNPEFVADQKNGIVDGYYYENGNIVYGAGLKEYNGGYIYVRSNGQVAIGKYWVTNTNGLMEAGYYTFGEDGMMIN